MMDLLSDYQLRRDAGTSGANPMELVTDIKGETNLELAIRKMKRSNGPVEMLIGR